MSTSEPGRHTKDNNASPQGREELEQEVSAPYCFTGCKHRQGVILICPVQQHWRYQTFSETGCKERRILRQIDYSNYTIVDSRRTKDYLYYLI